MKYQLFLVDQFNPYNVTSYKAAKSNVNAKIKS